VPIENLRQFIKEGPDSIVSQINIDGLDSPDIDTINRKVMNSRGEMLFAKALVFFEGETEEVALPIFAEAFWGQNIHMLGISFIGVGGYNSYLPFLRMAKNFNIPWYIFSDGEQRAISQLKRLTAEIGVSDPLSAKNIIILPDEQKWESYLVYQGYEDVIIKMLDKYHDTDNYIEMKIDELHGEKGKKGRIRDYKSEGGLQRALIDILSQNKTGYAGPLSMEIISIEDKARRFPGKILELFETVSKDLGLRHE
jgi:putative ATP-dependent endonuclease of OLD family